MSQSEAITFEPPVSGSAGTAARESWFFSKTALASEKHDKHRRYGSGATVMKMG